MPGRGNSELMHTYLFERKKMQRLNNILIFQGTFDVEIAEPAVIEELYRSMLCVAVGDVEVKGAKVCYDGSRVSVV